MNNDGDVAGYKDFVGGGVWRDGLFTPIGDEETVATSLNDAGHVIGYADRFGIYYAWVWKAGEKLDLGLGIPTCINNKGQIAGKDGFLWQNGHVYNLNARIGGDHPPIVSVEKITDDGIIVANSGKVILLPAELMVDGNRDGEMSFTNPSVHDADQTTEDKPYRFWVNNDDDVIHTVDGNDTEYDDESDGSKDCDYTTISNTRDLEDFTRLRINFGGLVGLVTDARYTVSLEWRSMDGAAILPAFDGTPEINVYEEREPDSRPLYLEDENVALRQLDSPYDTWISGREIGTGDGFFCTPAGPMRTHNG